MKDRERKCTHTIAGNGATADNKKNSFLLSGDGEWHTNGPVVISRYTQTRKKWLRAKIIKSGHGRHYKEALTVYKN